MPLAILSLRELHPLDLLVLIAGSGLRFLQEDPVPKNVVQEICRLTGFEVHAVQASLKKLVTLELAQDRGGGAYRFRPMAEWLEMTGIEGPRLNYQPQIGGQL